MYKNGCKLLYAFMVVMTLATGNTANAQATLQNAAPYPAPEFAGLETWLNSPPLTMQSLKGKVVLVDFWTYSCINCVRTLPYITAWDRKYRDKGLVIIGVHAPEFEFEKNADNVRAAIAKYGIAYPVALDNHLATWSSFNNQYWPAHYLINPAGQVVYTHFGEGQYAVTENHIRQLLGIKETVQPESENTASPGQTPETYLGYARANHFAGVPALIHDSAASYGFPAELGASEWALKGKWRVEAERIVALEKNAALRLHFTARTVFLVLGNAGREPVHVSVKLDNREKPSVTVDSHALYTLISGEKTISGVLEIQSDAPGLEAYAFTFGG